MEERALEVGVGRTVEAFLVHIDVDDGLEVIDRAVDIVFKFLLEGADAGSDQVGRGVDDNLLEFGAVGIRFVATVIGRDDVDGRPVVDGFIGRAGNQIEWQTGRPQDVAVAHDRGAAGEVAQIAVAAGKGVGRNARGDGIVGLHDGEVLDRVIFDVDGRVGVETIIAADEAVGQEGVVGDRGALGAVGVSDDLSGRIPSGAALSFPFGGGVARGD